MKRDKRKTLRPEREQDIQRSIIEWLEWNKYLVVKIANVGIFNQKTGSYIPQRQKGVSDLLVCKDGRFIAIEVKSPSGRLTEPQEAFLKQVEEHGGIGIVARSISDVEQAISKLQKELK